MNTRNDAIAGLRLFLASPDQILLMAGTYQHEKHTLVLNQLRQSTRPLSILFRANVRQNAETFLRPLGIPRVPRSGDLSWGQHSLYVDTQNPKSWGSSPQQVDVAITYPLDSLDSRGGPACVEDLQRRASKVFLVTWTDNKDMSWVEQYAQRLVVFDAEEERPDYHQRMMAICSNIPVESIARLPEYAQSTPPDHLIRRLCSGCGCARWSKLNKPFPGLPKLGNASEGDYVATCLICGGQATDSYNWYR